MKLADYFASYSQYHQTRGNKLTHYAGIPMIMFSLLGLLAAVSFGNGIDLGIALWLASSAFYIKLDYKRGIPFSILTFGLYWLSRFVALEVHWALFVLGWILQGIGHYVYEKKSPAFLTNISHILIGPFWIFCNFYSRNS